MIYVGIDIAKDKHDCFAMNSDGEILIENFTFQNNSDGFNLFFNSISQFNESLENVRRSFYCYNAYHRQLKALL